MLVAAGANRILTMDLHAQQIQGFFDIPVDHLYASPVFFEELKRLDAKNMTIFSPDVGGMKMANAYAEVLNCPLGFVAKRRTGASTVEAMNLVGEVEQCWRILFLQKTMQFTNDDYQITHFNNLSELVRSSSNKFFDNTHLLVFRF